MQLRTIPHKTNDPLKRGTNLYHEILCKEPIELQKGVGRGLAELINSYDFFVPGVGLSKTTILEA